ncbi:MAG: hypothetical protein RBS80_02135 [Thermoguttaceae bacterium]|jgi:hypothetical protein|nr:hypothetical protein [Thermoguttaceae bacterium]
MRIDRILEMLTGAELLVGLLWAGFAAFTVLVLVLIRTRWGQYRPLRKCLLLSILVHLLFMGYATTVQIVASVPSAREPEMRVSFVEGEQREATGEDAKQAEPKPWERFAHDNVSQPKPEDPERSESAEPIETEREATADAPKLPGDAVTDHVAMIEAQQPDPEPPRPEGATGVTEAGQQPQQIEAPPAQRRATVRLTVPAQREPQRQLVPVPRPEAPRQIGEPGVPAALVDRPLPLPELAEIRTTPDPADAVAGIADRAAGPPRLRSAASDVAYLPDDAFGTSEREPSGAEPPAAGEPDRAGRDVSGDQAAGQSDAGRQQPDVVEAGRVPGTVPDLYRLRVAPDRETQAQQRGASAESEAAVKAALQWLASTQQPDGRWSPAQFGAGVEKRIAGRDRQGAGSRAETGVGALALLAFLGAGNTHRDGEYQDNVRRGLEFLLRSQGAEGNLDGSATHFARMYCHAMAGLALAEAYGMTSDERLREPVRRAVQYTVNAQSTTSGGWRYVPGDPGDTSLLGWHLMLLKSAELAGIPTPQNTRNGMIRYLRSVASGTHGGLSTYRPGERVSRPMTAEALVCWQFLGMPREHPAGNEAGDYILEELPGSGQINLYYWYYATVGMYQLGSDHWGRWNEAMQRTLIDNQRKDGPLAGSWDTDTVWGGYGGRVYTTAMATLCLEVYYRFLPLYLEAAPRTEHQSNQ